MIDAGWAKRILFLCDRKELRKQAAKEKQNHSHRPQRAYSDGSKLFFNSLYSIITQFFIFQFF